MFIKKLQPILFTCLVLAGSISMAFSNHTVGTVRGTVTPADAGLRAFLFSAKDTLSANVANGAFQFSNVAAGNYRLMVEGAPPYRSAVKDGINVTDGQFTDAGQIELQK